MSRQKPVRTMTVLCQDSCLNFTSPGIRSTASHCHPFCPDCQNRAAELAVVTLKTLSNVQQFGSHWISHVGIKANEPAKKLYTQLHSHACEIYKHCRCCICMCLLPYCCIHASYPAMQPHTQVTTVHTHMWLIIFLHLFMPQRSRNSG